MIKIGLLLVALSPFFISLSAHSKLFRNSYVSFELPSNWDCSLEQTEWVCKNTSTKQSHEAVVILTAKEIGATDTFSAYLQHLKTPRTIVGTKGKPLPSKVIHVKKVTINNQDWIDGWHLNSELPNYYTRYLATIKDKVAILVTFSAHKLHYTRYSGEFFKGIKTLRVMAVKSQPIAQTDVGMGSKESIGQPIDALMNSGNLDIENFPQEETWDTTSTNTSFLIGIALLLIALGVYLYIKKFRNN